MPIIIGIDYGTEIIGVSLATTPLAEPLAILDHNTDLVTKIKRIVSEHGVEKIVVGISEGVMAEKSRDFGQQLSQQLPIPVEYHDETLTSVEAKAKLSHAKKSVRDDPQDAYQAAVMLQDYLDTHPQLFYLPTT